MARSRTHECPGGCGQQVDRAYYACRSCWLRLPGSLRQSILAAKRKTTAHATAMYEAHEWFRANPPLDRRSGDQ